MRVLVLTQHYPSRREPTVAPWSQHTYRALARHCDVRLVAPIAWWARAREAPLELIRTPRETHTGIDALFPSYWSVPKVPQLHAAAVYHSLRPLLARIRREYPWDVLLAAWAYPDTAAAARFADEYETPLVTTVLGSDVNEAASWPALRPQISQALQRCQRVIAVSAALGERVEELGVPHERVTVLHNAVDGARFTPQDKAPARATLGIPEGVKLVLYAGYHLPEKGVDVLIEAMGKLDRMGRHDIHLLTVGGGPLLEPLKARAAALGLGERARLLGWALPKDIPGYMAACDVFCLPSRREGCPNVVLEALASGRPVVASRVGGVPELVREGDDPNGILVPADDPDALAQALAAAADRTWDPQALRSTVESLSWNDVGNRYRDILTDVVHAFRHG
ncbi:glycosyltransferase family 4 protein [Chondromyces apiculatus]|uniref:glycosyltransferase family 4 protein n=1 Tax=Chondromyces apiculatus TaxID=51 RepID=UPI0006949E9A|nr:glycosyltransferase family 4 protein [Chondromyces apiculatus]